MKLKDILGKLIAAYQASTAQGAESITQLPALGSVIAKDHHT